MEIDSRDGYILDTTILIDMNFGTKIKKDKINSIILDKPLFTTSIIVGEFKRITLVTLKKLITEYEKNLNNIGLYENDPNEYIKDLIKDIAFYSKHRQNLAIKLVSLFLEELERYINRYNQNDIPLSIMFDKIMDDFNHAEKTYLAKIKILTKSYNCEYVNRRVLRNPIENNLVFTKPPCSSCIPNFINEFSTKYSEELGLILSLEDTLNWNNEEKEKFIKNLKNLLKRRDEKRSSNICWRLVDLLLILETPKNLVLLTTNKIHFLPICNILEKNAEYIS